MDYRFLLQLIIMFSLAPGVVAENLSLRMHGSNTVGALLAQILARAWL